MSTEKDTSRLKIKIPQKEIVFLDMLFKSYEGLAMVTVNKKEKGIIYLDVTEGTRGEVINILRDLQERMPLKIY
ncbi:MAG TPA: DUF4911 domain-containing protein [Halanaerobiales bacterium]|nr:DUF4911 domain-containing protein [Halanaerobiales bacterium]